MTEDLDVFFADFGIAVTVAPHTDAAAVISGIFDNAYYESEEFAGVMPRLIIKASDVNDRNIAVGSVLTINQIDYTVAYPPQPDGTGLAELWLRYA